MLAAFSVYAVSQALTISRQNTEIFKTNVALEEQIGETQLSQSKFLTSLAKKQYEKGNELAAVQLALEALPRTSLTPKDRYTATL